MCSVDICNFLALSLIVLSVRTIDSTDNYTSARGGSFSKHSRRYLGEFLAVPI